MAEERIGEISYRSVVIIQCKEQKEKMKKMSRDQGTCGTPSGVTTYTKWEFQQERNERKRQKNL